MSPLAPASLLKMSALARASGVPAATIKHYLREGLLPPEHVIRGRNVAYYHPALVERVRAIKELQRTRFLPLKVIKGVLEGEIGHSDAVTAEAIGRVLAEGTSSRSRAELLAAGMPEAQLDYFCAIGAVVPDRAGGEERYVGDSLALLQILGAARRAGLTEHMLPVEVLEPYMKAVAEIVRTELRLLRECVVPHAGRHLPGLVEAGAKLSEQMILLLRRRMLLPTLRELIAEEAALAPSAAGPRARQTTTAPPRPRPTRTP